MKLNFKEADIKEYKKQLKDIDKRMEDLKKLKKKVEIRLKNKMRE